MWDDWALSLTIFVPALGAALIGLVPRAREDLIKGIAVLATAATMVVSIFLAIDFDFSDTARMQFEVDATWIDVINSRYHVGVDGISLGLVLMTTVITFLCVVYSWNHFPEPHNPKAFLILLLILEVGLSGTFLALDLILFFIFFEIVLLPMYFMIAVWGGPNRQYAAIKFFLFTLFGSAFMLLGFLAIYFRSDVPGVGHSFDVLLLADQGGAGAFAGDFGTIAFFALFLGFAVKVPMFPLHTWLPDAHTEAPTVGSVILAAIMLKLGTYAFVRIALPILPEASQDWAPVIAILAVIGIIYGALACLAQTDVKRLIAFSSVAHMGFVMLGIATLTDVGINAAIIGMIAHGIITGMLFFLAGSLQHRYHTREMSRLGGNLKKLPILGTILGFCAFASLGLPGLAGFPGEFMSLLSAYRPFGALSEELFRVLMVIGAVGTVLAAGYLLWMLQRVNLGEIPGEWRPVEMHDVETAEVLAWSPLLVLILAIGVYPQLVFGITDDAVVNLVQTTFGG